MKEKAMETYVAQKAYRAGFNAFVAGMAKSEKSAKYAASLQGFAHENLIAKYIENWVNGWIAAKTRGPNMVTLPYKY